MFEVILRVDHDPSNLYHGYFMFLRALRVYNAKVASHKKASATTLLNHNSHLWRIVITCLLLLSSLWSTYSHLWKIDLVDVFLVSVDVS
jgi:hypothetical protein